MRRHRASVILAALGAVLAAVGLTVTLTAYDLEPVGTGVMAPTVPRGADTLIAVDGPPRRGDVVIVDSAAWFGEKPGGRYALRVAAVGGDTVACCDAGGKLIVNGTPLGEPYASGDTGTFREITVPEGRVFLLADRRDVGLDSRAHLGAGDGTVPVSAVLGRVTAALPLTPIGDDPGGGTRTGTWLFLVSLPMSGAGILIVAGMAVWAGFAAGRRMLRSRTRRRDGDVQVVPGR